MMGITANTASVLFVAVAIGGPVALSRFVYDKTGFNIFFQKNPPPRYRDTLTFSVLSVVVGVPFMHYTNPAGRIRY